jgi:Big-like domain-containing protein
MIKYKKSLVFIMAILLFAACSEDPTANNEEVDPEILSVRLDQQWDLSSSEIALIEVKVSDPQGPADLKNVVLKVKNISAETVFTDSLYDDGGLNGSNDLIAGDGVFRNVFLPVDVTLKEGDYTFVFEVMDKAGHAAENLEQPVTFLALAQASVTKIDAPSLLPSGSGPIIITAIAAIKDNAFGAVKMFMDLRQNNQSVLSKPIQMANDGNTANSGDLLAGDSVYTYKMDSTFAAGKQGTYTLRFYAQNNVGAKSDAIVQEIILENKVGKILLTTVPESITRPAEGFAQALITAKINDPQGLADIDSVYFNSSKPDGNPASGNPFVMVDNGLAFNIANPFVEAGDAVEEDGTFSLTILVDNNNSPGVYTFTFYLRDKAGNLSSAHIDSIEVK